MTSVTIRDLPDHVRDELAARAARSGRSLQQYLWQQLTDLAARPDMDTLLAEIRRRKEVSPTTVDVAEMLHWRDQDRALDEMLVINASVVVAALLDSSSVSVWAERQLAGGALAAPHLCLAESANLVRRA